MFGPLTFKDRQCIFKDRIKYRGNGAKEARQAHNLKTVGAIPTPAIRDARTGSRFN